jgi:hypothetical protein
MHGTARSFPGRPWLINGLRVAHLVGVVGFGAVLLAGQPPAACGPWCTVMLVSGLGIAALDWWAEPTYPLQLKGLAMLLKLAMVAGLFAWPAIALEGFWIVLGFSGLLSHAPGSLRKRRWWPPAARD